MKATKTFQSPDHHHITSSTFLKIIILSFLSLSLLLFFLLSHSDLQLQLPSFSSPTTTTATATATTISISNALPPDAFAPLPPPKAVQRTGIVDENGLMTDNFVVGEFDPTDDFVVGEFDPSVIESVVNNGATNRRRKWRVRFGKFMVCDESMVRFGKFMVYGFMVWIEEQSFMMIFKHSSLQWRFVCCVCISVEAITVDREEKLDLVCAGCVMRWV
ncbi:putative methyltransferase PMT10 [Camellia lanceoleosa]|uniref:Methyltransferase PMT10 n=1 Tax=Camellia lanceoleosa TaxID=1840588 RepID=A0ACC0FKY0_9ERIC|nr:putative methyltransferase PMT10 [Camellia lanceoleosa]